MDPIKIDITILAPVEKVWDYFNTPKHIMNWNFAHESWQCPSSENDLRIGGKFNNRMEAKDGSFGFDFEGTYDDIIPHEKIQYHIADGRNVEVIFERIDDNATKVAQIFEPEKQNSVEMQRDGWYAILNNFHKYVENN
ncbi:SRPBCC family protein [Chryseobacterium chendengshani]|uniref:SRPBCC family protein n=1 Tax=unclassified Chryseobacterium TaxID=2593645 RepID=UPI001C63E371|nr:MULTISPECIES: SRPBCC family protein [unclassified Chryseobacterium]MBW7674822.1 SRPBCC family protein [Chryseobacterium sp. LJ756]MBW8523634.1 SRPBCC family protein [Chryseobacterium sp. LJ668]QYK15916.1 SRPBCC family protein [Chryseobacterium sp. LJ668]